MKILIFGRGIIGALYGWALEQSGNTVEFYVRPDRAAQNGPVLPVRFYDARFKFRGTLVQESWPITQIEEISADHNYDVIIISVQHQLFAQAAKALTGKAGNATLLMFNNFWTDPLLAVSSLPTDQLAWGFPGAGGAFDTHGTLHGGLLKQVQFGTFGADPSAREVAVRQLFSAAGFKIKEHRDFRSWLYMHFAANAGIHLEALRANSVRAVFYSKTHAQSAIRSTQELLPLLNARGVDTTVDASDLALYKLPPWVGARVLKMSVTFFPPLTAAILHNEPREELKRFCQDVLFEAHRLGVELPSFEASSSLFEV